MDITIAVVISLAALMATLYYNSKTAKRNTTKDDKEEAGQMSRVESKLDNIDRNVIDIKKEVESVKRDQRDDHDRIIRLEEAIRKE